MTRVVIKESQVLKSVLQYLALTGIYHWRNNTGAAKIGNRYVKFGVSGLPDVLGILPGGRLLAVEVKSATGKLSTAQESAIERMRAAGALVIVVRSVEELRSGLRDAGYDVV